MNELFEKLKKEDPLKAQIVGYNLFFKKNADIEIFKEYVEFCISCADCNSDDFNVSHYFIDEAEKAVQIFSTECNMTEESISLITDIGNKIETLDEKLHKIEDERIRKNNGQILKKLENSILSVHENNPDVLLKYDSALIKNLFTDKQKSKYEELSNKLKNCLAEELEKQNKEKNTKAVESFHAALNLFKKEKAYKKDEKLLEKLVTDYFKPFKASELQAESVLYYNYVYGQIFAKLNDELKFKFTIMCTE